MSQYTLVALCILVAADIGVLTMMGKWIVGELGVLRRSVKVHKEYIDSNTEVINNIHIDLAVQKSSLSDIKADIREIKALIVSINATLMDMK